ncbi:hypothetical protein ABZW49_48205, partial [Nonomuraea wenchangensis]
MRGLRGLRDAEPFEADGHAARAVEEADAVAEQDGRDEHQDLVQASAGASSAYLTVSEIFPMETRAMAIAFFFAI